MRSPIAYQHIDKNTHAQAFRASNHHNEAFPNWGLRYQAFYVNVLTYDGECIESYWYPDEFCGMHGGKEKEAAHACINDAIAQHEAKIAAERDYRYRMRNGL